MAISQRWAGKFYGTNIGNLFVRFEGNEGNLAGILRFNELGAGVSQYRMVGKYDGTLNLEGESLQGSKFGGTRLGVTARLNRRGQFEGDWETDSGLAGTLVMFPHDRSDVSAPEEPMPAQLHTARHRLAAVHIDRRDIERLAQNIQENMRTGRAIVTILAGTEQSRFIEDFKNLTFETERADVLKIFVRGPEIEGISNVVSIEFGPEFNEIMTQGADEAWVLGTLEALKRLLRKHERNYATRFKRVGFGFNQLLVAGAVVYLPSIDSLQNRVLFFGGISVIVVVVNWLHRKFLPHAAIHLATGRKRWADFTSPLWSWFIAVTAAVVATLLAAFLEGWLSAFFGA